MFRRPDRRWRKSQHSNPNGACVEVGQRRLRRRWRKSRHSRANGNCAEVAGGTQILVRDTTDRGGPRLGFTPQAWEGFLARVKAAG